MSKNSIYHNYIMFMHLLVYTKYFFIMKSLNSYSFLSYRFPFETQFNIKNAYLFLYWTTIPGMLTGQNRSLEQRMAAS